MEEHSMTEKARKGSYSMMPETCIGSVQRMLLKKDAKGRSQAAKVSKAVLERLIRSTDQLKLEIEEQSRQSKILEQLVQEVIKERKLEKPSELVGTGETGTGTGIGSELEIKEQLRQSKILEQLVEEVTKEKKLEKPSELVRTGVTGTGDVQRCKYNQTERRKRVELRQASTDELDSGISSLNSSTLALNRYVCNLQLSSTEDFAGIVSSRETSLSHSSICISTASKYDDENGDTDEDEDDGDDSYDTCNSSVEASRCCKNEGGDDAGCDAGCEAAAKDTKSAIQYDSDHLDYPNYSNNEIHGESHTFESSHAYFRTLGLTEAFFQSFWSRKNEQEFGDSETDLGWIQLMMEEIYEDFDDETLKNLTSAEVLQELGYTQIEAASYGQFIDNSIFKDSDNMLGWAMLRIEESDLFDYHSGNFIQSANPDHASSGHEGPEPTKGDQATVEIEFITKKMKRLICKKGGSVSTSEFEQKMEEMEADGYKLWFHGTTTTSANWIINNQIKIAKGRKFRDFSSGKGFYLCDKAIFARSYCQQRHQQKPVSVLIFRLENDFLSSQERGLDLRFNYRAGRGGVGMPNTEHVADADKETLARWKRVIRHYRELNGVVQEDQGFSDWIDSRHYIAGPVSDSMKEPNLKRPPCDGHQLCIKTRALADLMRERLVGVVHFEQNDTGGD